MRQGHDVRQREDAEDGKSREGSAGSMILARRLASGRPTGGARRFRTALGPRAADVGKPPWRYTASNYRTTSRQKKERKQRGAQGFHGPSGGGKSDQIAARGRRWRALCAGGDARSRRLTRLLDSEERRGCANTSVAWSMRTARPTTRAEKGQRQAVSIGPGSCTAAAETELGRRADEWRRARASRCALPRPLPPGAQRSVGVSRRLVDRGHMRKAQLRFLQRCPRPLANAARPLILRVRVSRTAFRPANPCLCEWLQPNARRVFA